MMLFLHLITLHFPTSSAPQRARRRLAASPSASAPTSAVGLRPHSSLCIACSAALCPLCAGTGRMSTCCQLSPCRTHPTCSVKCLCRCCSLVRIWILR
uniref:Secreted protein n=1 Tax=Setaria viridis TaxID=4556 RepID=A0A4U6UG32_SETVI|nr:hypothetical protein SEVIR_6G093250v2 [Setaria viridis]